MRGQEGRHRGGNLSPQKSSWKLGALMSSRRGERRMQDFGPGSEFEKGSKRGGELVRYLEKKPSAAAGGKPR